MSTLVGGIEGGGTKFVCAVGDNEKNIIARTKFLTLSPEETLPKIFDFFDTYQISSMCIGSFGPIDIDKASSTYGYVTNTPKLSWKRFNFLGAMKQRYKVPFVWTTDVNIAAYGEYSLGAGKGYRNVLYVTIGTGVGVGYVHHDILYKGYNHPEAGHLFLHKRKNDDFEGVCPYHNDCIEGLVSGPALEKRTGKEGRLLKQDDPVWNIEAYYLAQTCMDYSLTFSPDLIILGGGVMKQRQLFPLIRSNLKKLVNNYVQFPELNDYIVPTKLGDDSGIIGSLLLARNKLNN
ncbi:ROK family protein [Sporolactobacillus sp. CQH2019]|uniref:ROK family protein n=1 Tax=Sporolactobacillus sp. CQH2019 TaxID=3023512 RepID=UPI0023689262|nr:ROK family protein [Sporolactobacillus sp. CQH2019]MDD9147476.1 ROK family protein [Sporolactobacillus sp. CQH2019]